MHSERAHHNPLNNPGQRARLHHWQQVRQPTTIDFRNSKLGATIAPLSFDSHEAVRLSQLEIVEQRQELSKNLEGFRDEVLNDMPISHRFHYYYDKEGDVYNHPDRKPIHRFDTQFNPLERDGLPLIGFKKATSLLLENPSSTVLLYSPPGLATEDTDPTNPFARYPFIYGQLYIMNFDGEKIKEVAVKIDHEGEPLLAQFMPDRFHEADQIQGDYDRVKFFVQNPIALEGQIQDLSRLNWTDGQIYGGKTAEHNSRTVLQMLSEVRQKFSQAEVASDSELDALVQNLTLAQLADKQSIARLYLGLIAAHPTMLRDGKMSLLGACGGSVKTLNEIKAMLGDGLIENIGSTYRMLTQGDYMNQFLTGQATDETGTHYESYNCQRCNRRLSGESKDDESLWRKSCPCGEPLRC